MRVVGYVGVRMVKTVIARPLYGGARWQAERDNDIGKPSGKNKGPVGEHPVYAQPYSNPAKQIIHHPKYQQLYHRVGILP